VSNEDFKLAKRFDLDGNGVIDADEKAIAQKTLAKDFFARHEHELQAFGRNVANRTTKQNVDHLVKSYKFFFYYYYFFSELIHYLFYVKRRFI
jgi:hypothetical protein